MIGERGTGTSNFGAMQSVRPKMIKPKGLEVDHWKANEGRSKTIKRVERLKPTFKELLAKYEDGKVGQNGASRPNNFKQPRSPTKQKFDGRDHRRVDFRAAAPYPPFGPPMPVPWGPPPVGFPPCPLWGWCGPWVPPPMPFGLFHQGWIAPRRPVFDRLSRPNNDHFDQRNRSYDGRCNKVVKKVYRVKNNGNLCERSGLNSKEKRANYREGGGAKTVGYRCFKY